MIGASSNTEENLSFDEAFARVQSGDQKVFKEIADQMTRKMGLRGTSYSAVGDWEDGAEQSILTQIPDQVDMDTLRYVGAWQGLTGNQRAVLVFRPDHGGLDSVYQIQVPETDVAKVRAQLSRHGVQHRTLVPGRQGTKVVIYDQKRALRDNVTQFAQAYNAPVRESVGSGDYVGGSSRSAARAAYRKIIAEYEAKTGRQPTQAGGQVHAQQAGQSGRGRRPEAQEAPV